MLYITARGAVVDFNCVMSSQGIALELCDLLQKQLDSIIGRKLTDFTPRETDEYEKRRFRVAELRLKLHRMANAAPSTAIPRLKPASGCRAAR